MLIAKNSDGLCLHSIYVIHSPGKKEILHFLCRKNPHSFHSTDSTILKRKQPSDLDAIQFGSGFQKENLPL